MFSRPFTQIAPSTSMKGNNLAMFKVFVISLVLVIDPETSGKPSFWSNENKIDSAWSSALTGPSALFWASWNWQQKLSIDWNYCIVSRWSSLVSKATVLVACFNFDHLAPPLWQPVFIWLEPCSFNQSAFLRH